MDSVRKMALNVISAFAGLDGTIRLVTQMDAYGSYRNEHGVLGIDVCLE